MPYNDALFWVGLTMAGTGGYFLVEGERRQLLSAALTALGSLAVVYSVYRHYHPEAPALPPLWVVLLFFTWLAIAFEVYDRHRTARVSPTQAMTPIRALERHYLALASLREHVGRMNDLREVGGSLSASAFIDIDLALRKMRKELVDLSPQVFTTSEALDFRETVWSDPETLELAEERVPREIDHLMTTILSHWGRHGEAVGITPLRFGNSTIVKLGDE